MIGKNVVILGGKRTPIGTFLGGLSGFTAPALGTAALKGAIAAAHIDAADIEEVYMGQVIQAGSGQAPARQVALGAGCDKNTPSTTINKVCASGMKSVMMASQSIRLGDRTVMAAGGMEVLSKVPHYASLRTPTAYGHSNLVDGIAFDGLTDVYNNTPMGTCTEKVNSEMGITREHQDEWAIRSYERARKAQADGVFDWEIVDIVNQTRKGEVRISKDEECQKFMPEKFHTLKPAFLKNGTITAANASKLNDGASVTILSSEDFALERGIKPIAKILAYGDAATTPIDFAIAPALACENALKMAGLTVDDIDFHEINEAFASVPIANCKLLGINPDKVNVHGGAVALGHPIGVSGNRIILSLINTLRLNKGGIGMASICNGGGGASAIILQVE